MNYGLQVVGTLQGPAGLAGTDATVQVVLIPPWGGAPGAGRFMYKVTQPNRQFGEGVTHVTTVCYTTGDTAHKIGIMRPFNYTYLTAAIAANGTGLTIKADPGVYSTNYNYPCPGGLPVVTADNAIATNDYVAIQLVDGNFHVSKIASGTFGGANLVLTTAVPNITGGGAAIGAPVYFFGQLTTDVNPATNAVNPQTTIALSQTRDKTWTDSVGGIVAALNPGDPLLFYSPHTVHLGVLEYIAGFYAKV